MILEKTCQFRNIFNKFNFTNYKFAQDKKFKIQLDRVFYHAAIYLQVQYTTGKSGETGFLEKLHKMKKTNQKKKLII